MHKSSLWVILFLVSRCYSFDFQSQTSSEFVNVRPGAHMFYWLFYASHLNHGDYVTRKDYGEYPLVIWLQGGPGSSSTGFGNFELMGPFTPDLKVRESSWIQYANLLFIDNPVGTGFSYVTQDSAFTTDNQLIGEDLVTTMQHFMKKHSNFETIPLYIFGESYGGKMAVAFAKQLQESIEKNQIKCNFKGIVLGDSWISPIDAVQSWAPYLTAFSLVDKREAEVVMSRANEIKQNLASGQFKRATANWGNLEGTISQFTASADWYYVLHHALYRRKSRGFAPSFVRRVKTESESLDDLMNGRIAQVLNIPDGVSWGSQSSDVFQFLSGDFMKPVVEDVDYILHNLPITVTVYNGQLDLIVNTLGTEKWVNNLTYVKESQFQSRKKNLITSNQGEVLGFTQTTGKFTFFWALMAGHMVPRDSPKMGLEIMLRTTQQP